MPDRFEPTMLGPFDGGLNTVDLPTEIADNELAACLNVEYSRGKTPISRLGVKCHCTTATASHPFGGPPTSIHDLKNSNTHANGSLIVTSRAQVYSSASQNIENTTYASIKGAATITDNARWQWRTFFDVNLGIPIAIGVNGQNSGTNPVKWTGTGNISQLEFSYTTPGTPAPRGVFMEVFNRRVWLVDTDNRNKIYWSRLGDSEVWTLQVSASGSGFAELREGGDITGMVATNERLWIFKRDRIYYLDPGQPETDQLLFQFKMLTSEGGCINGYGIKVLLDDVIFPSDYGYVSLRSIQSTGNFKNSLIPDKILDLRRIVQRGSSGNLDTIASTVNPENQQLIISIPDPTKDEADIQHNDIAYVYHYKERGHDSILINDRTQFTKFDGPIAGSAYHLATYKNRTRLFVGYKIPMTVPSGVIAAAAAGGSLADGDYFFKIVAVDVYGHETSPSLEVSATISGGGGTGRVELDWTAVPNATNIRVYKGTTAGGEDRYQQIAGNSIAYDYDSDAGATVQDPPVLNEAVEGNVGLYGEPDQLVDELRKPAGVAVSENYEKSITTKAYTFGNEAIMKMVDWYREILRLFTRNLTLVIGYRYDENYKKEKRRSFGFTADEGSLYGEAVYGTDVYSGSSSPSSKAGRRVSGDPGRKFQSIQFIFRTKTPERFGVKGVSIGVAKIDEKETSHV